MSETLTTELAAEVHRLADQSLPLEVIDMARQSLLNVVGTAIGASQESAVDYIVAVHGAHGGHATVGILGRNEALDPLGAAVANGLAAHYDDFDDTHLATVIHPAAATMAAALPMGVIRSATGRQVLAAFALGCEVQLRVGVAMSPEHYDDGWHITGTCAPIGAAVASGLIAGLDPERLSHAIGVAVSQTLGQREGFGTMIKPFHPGKGGANGLLGALLAERGFTAPARALDGPRGYFAAISPNGYRLGSIMDGLGDRWEFTSNTFKPYPCGIVTHPVIDAAIELSPQVQDASTVEEITARVHPLVPELTGRMDPSNGLEARFSTAHGLVAGLVDGRVGLAQYHDNRVSAPDLTDLRRKVRYEVDEEMPRAAAAVNVRLRDGETLHAHVPHARGSLERPLTRAELIAKVDHLVDPVLPGRTDELVEAVDTLDSATSLLTLMAASTNKDPI